MNIKERCYGYQPAADQLADLKECVRILQCCLREQYEHGLILRDTYKEAITIVNKAEKSV